MAINTGLKYPGNDACTLIVFLQNKRNMKNCTPQLPLILALAFMLFSFSTQAQDKTKRIGNKPRTGSSNTSFAVAKGHQVGIKMNAGRKVVQLLSLDFGVSNNNADTLGFKVNVYDFKGEQPGENLVKDDIINGIPPGKSRVTVELSKYNIKAKGDILVSIEFLDVKLGANPSFAIGLFNGGTYHCEDSEWKKMPVAGVDFNVMVKTLPKSKQQ